MEPTRLTYVTDTYCVWCWGFGEALRQFVREQAGQVEVEVLPGGMLVGDRVVPVGQKTNVLEGAQRVQELTGATFGDGFRAAVRDGRTVLDSTASAVAFWALRSQAPQRDLDIAHALQKAWYVDGLDLREEDVVRGVAHELGLDPDEAIRRWQDPATLEQARAGFARRQQLPVKGYPTLLVNLPDGPKRLGGSLATPEKLERDLAALLRGEDVEESDD